MLPLCDPSYSLKICFRPPSNPTHPAHPKVGGSTHVDLFMCTVFHINLFELEYYMPVHYKRADIKMPTLLCVLVHTDWNVDYVTEVTFDHIYNITALFYVVLQ